MVGADHGSSAVNLHHGVPRKGPGPVVATIPRHCRRMVMRYLQEHQPCEHHFSLNVPLPTTAPGPRRMFTK